SGHFDTTCNVNGAAGRNRTCIDSFRRRMPRLFRPWQRLDWINGLVDWRMAKKAMREVVRREFINPFIHQVRSEMVSAAGFAPAITRSQAEHVGCYTTRWSCPDRCRQGSRIAGHKPWQGPAVRSLKNGGPEGSCTLNPPADNGA